MKRRALAIVLVVVVALCAVSPAFAQYGEGDTWPNHPWDYLYAIIWLKYMMLYSAGPWGYVEVDASTWG
jgi:hypothetical protein